MRNTILTILGSALIAASVSQAASAAEHHAIRNAHHERASASELFRNSNAYVSPPASVRSDWSRYEDVPMAPPAGH